MVPQRLLTHSGGWLLAWAAVKTCMVPPLLAALTMPGAGFGDAWVVALVALFWLMSGYINTCAYLLAPAGVPPESKPQAGGMMAFTFQMSCFLSLLLAWLLHGWLSSAHHEQFATAGP